MVYRHSSSVYRQGFINLKYDLNVTKKITYFFIYIVYHMIKFYLKTYIIIHLLTVVTEEHEDGKPNIPLTQRDGNW